MAKISGRKIFNRIYEVISTVMIVTAVILAAMYLRGIRFYHVKSGSMGDLLPVGCVCFVDTHYDFEKVDIGDVIAFRVDKDTLVTHRAVRSAKDGIYTRGDENDAEDPKPVTADNYIGRTFFELPHIGAALAFFHTIKGKAVLAAAVIMIAAAGIFYRNNNRDSDTEKNI